MECVWLNIPARLRILFLLPERGRGQNKSWDRDRDAGVYNASYPDTPFRRLT
jgi:hypothetical protein